MDLQVKSMAPLIQVFDMPQSLHFYRDQLGFTLVNRSGETDDCGWSRLRLNGVEIMLNTIKKPETDRLVPTQRVMRRTQTCAFSSGALMWMPSTDSSVTLAFP